MSQNYLQNKFCSCGWNPISNFYFYQYRYTYYVYEGFSVKNQVWMYKVLNSYNTKSLENKFQVSKILSVSFLKLATICVVTLLFSMVVFSWFLCIFPFIYVFLCFQNDFLMVSIFSRNIYDRHKTYIFNTFSV